MLPNAFRTLHLVPACDGTHSLVVDQVGRSSSITLSQTIPAPPPSATTVPLPDGAQTAEGKDNSKRDDENNAVLAVRESLADKVRDAAAAAAASLVQATSAAARGSALGGGESRMEGRWDEETFLLPLPDGDDTFLAANSGGDDSRDDDDNPDTEKCGASVSRPSELAAQGSGDEDCDAAGRESSSVSVDDGVHLRVEIWQGKHCHGQVDYVFVEYLKHPRR